MSTKEIFESLPHVDTIWVNPENDGEWTIHRHSGTNGWKEVNRTNANTPAAEKEPAGSSDEKSEEVGTEEKSAGKPTQKKK